MDYSQLSDFEINKRIAVVLGHSIDEEKYGNASVGAFHSDGVVYKSHDYCNNPADAWPIIESNGITIINDKNCFPRATNDSYAFINEQYDECLHALAGNPLRAAMIVFLMMQDANHV
ncbi:DUF2591 family protein [Enterobacter roggenkampii]|uniref:phage protein NinX family protein n=1 Tax=Enterobacter roggenkampii TaxID=1812935 RepID=UPI00223709CE|nr:phage protein NinX family protein [Enterobacter roggenkampii]MCW5001041.1 DUF2591 family protein [Enterobacter roggenkampii]